MKKIFCMMVVLCGVFGFSACSCEHENAGEATCVQDGKCPDCGEVTEKATNEHKWKSQTCTEAKTCTECGVTEGLPKGHEWKAATCVMPKTCSICGQTEGDANGQSFSEATVIKESTCSEPGVKQASCSICAEISETEIPTVAHTPGEWEIVLEATATKEGKKAQKCSVCGGTISEEWFKKSAEEIKADYLLNCADYTYKEIARNPGNYSGKYAHFRGEIIQSVEEGNSYTFRVNVTRVSYGYTDTILVTYTKKQASESRILEGDIVDIYGTLDGTRTYETVMGNEVTIPMLLAEYININ